MKVYATAVCVFMCLMLQTVQTDAAFLIYVTTIERQGYQVYALDTDTKAVQALGSTGFNTEVVFDRSAARFAVVYSKDYTAQRQLHLFDASTLNKLKQLELQNTMLYQWPPQRSNGAFSPSGKRIALVRLNTEAKGIEDALHFDVFDLETGAREVTVPFQEQMIRKPVLKWVADERLLVVSNDTGVARTYAIGSPRPVAEIRLPDFSPALRADPRGPLPEMFFIDVSEGILGITNGGESRLYRVSESGLDPSAVTTYQLWKGEGPKVFGSIAQSVDRRWLAIPLVDLGVTKTDKSDKYFFIDTTKLPSVRRVNAEVSFSHAVVSFDGEEMAVSSGGADIHILKADTGKLLKAYKVEGVEPLLVGFIGRHGERSAGIYASSAAEVSWWLIIVAVGVTGLLIAALYVLRKRRTNT